MAPFLLEPTSVICNVRIYTCSQIRILHKFFFSERNESVAYMNVWRHWMVSSPFPLPVAGEKRSFFTGNLCKSLTHSSSSTEHRTQNNNWCLPFSLSFFLPSSSFSSSPEKMGNCGFIPIFFVSLCTDIDWSHWENHGQRNISPAMGALKKVYIFFRGAFTTLKNGDKGKKMDNQYIFFSKDKKRVSRQPSYNYA